MIITTLLAIFMVMQVRLFSYLKTWAIKKMEQVFFLIKKGRLYSLVILLIVGKKNHWL